MAQNNHPLTKFILVSILATAAVFMSSCKKDKVRNGSSNVTEISEAVSLGNLKPISVDFVAGNETVTAITLKNQSSGSGGSVHVKLSLDNAAVTAAKLMPLPANAYTLSTLEYDVPANGTLTVPITLNKSNLTVDTVYGIGFKLDMVSSGTIASNGKNIVVSVSLRNRLDGRYKVTGTLTDFSDPTISLPEQEILVITTSPTQVKIIPKQLGIEGHLINVGSSLSYYGSFGPVVNFDATNKITSVINFYGQPAANTRSAQLDPSGTNTWSASTKNIAIKFWMNQPNVISPHRSLFNTTWTYLGPR